MGSDAMECNLAQWNAGCSGSICQLWQDCRPPPQEAAGPWARAGHLGMHRDHQRAGLQWCPRHLDVSNLSTVGQMEIWISIRSTNRIAIRIYRSMCMTSSTSESKESVTSGIDWKSDSNRIESSRHTIHRRLDNEDYPELCRCDPSYSALQYHQFKFAVCTGALQAWPFQKKKVLCSVYQYSLYGIRICILNIHRAVSLLALCMQVLPYSGAFYSRRLLLVLTTVDNHFSLF